MAANKNKKFNIDPEKLLEASFDAIQDGISILDTDLNILRVNKVIKNGIPQPCQYMEKNVTRLTMVLKKPALIVLLFKL